jgi:hypothetical protein
MLVFPRKKTKLNLSLVRRANIKILVVPNHIKLPDLSILSSVNRV